MTMMTSVGSRVNLPKCCSVGSAEIYIPASKSKKLHAVTTTHIFLDSFIGQSELQNNEKFDASHTYKYATHRTMDKVPSSLSRGIQGFIKCRSSVKFHW